MELEELMVKALAKRKNIPEEQAQAFLEAVRGTDEYEELKQSLARLVDTGQIVQQLPGQMQPLAMPLMMQAVQGGKSSPEKIAERVATITAAIKAAYPDDSSKLIEDLRKEIQELKEEKQKKEMEEALGQVAGAFQEYAKALEQRVAQLESELGGKGGNKEGGDEIDKLERYLEKVEQTKEKLKRLGLVKEGKGEELDPTKAAEVLKKLGYKVEPPPSYEQMRRILDQELKKREGEMRKQLEQELGIQEKKFTMAMDFAMAILDGIVSAATSPQPSEITKFTQAVRNIFGGMSGGGGGVEESVAGGSGAVEANIEAGEHSEQAG